mmetsp:Transcript_18586/g.40478  ORF Transcript_18586/g.40478 Transcript_18586/m.40478 type:complete len:85 (+) Transcript_18586:80-334(+)
MKLKLKLKQFKQKRGGECCCSHGEMDGWMDAIIQPTQQPQAKILCDSTIINTINLHHLQTYYSWRNKFWVAGGIYEESRSHESR